MINIGKQFSNSELTNNIKIILHITLIKGSVTLIKGSVTLIKGSVTLIKGTRLL